MGIDDEQTICTIVGRELDPSELEMFDDLEEISGAVARLTMTIASRDPIQACKYLAARVTPSPLPDLVRLKVETLLEIARRPTPVGEHQWLDETDRQDIRRVLGHELEPSELERFDSLDAISPEVAAITGRLAAYCSRILACRYLIDRVPTGEWGGDVMWKVQELEIVERERNKQAR